MDQKAYAPLPRMICSRTNFAKVQPVLVVEKPDDGFKLFHVGPAPKVDIVAVHGLGGHREKSWTTPDGVNWLRSLLSQDIPNSRIMSWGYNASSGPGQEQHSLQNLSEKLVLDLYRLREMTKTQTRPIIFMAHSLGGSIVKSALVFSDLERERPASRLDVISASTRGIFFFDTTELGISTHGMSKYLKSVEGSDQENSDIFKEAKWLLSVLNQYLSNSAKYRNVYVTPRNGQEAIQKEEKGDASSSQINSSYIVISASHNMINKFGSVEDEGYVKIKEEISDILEESSWSTDSHVKWDK
ncbi:uncharacterized protein N7483_011404 [Penicillium malachiteum]|uniref:uncharacterized protein n=1 Tax=Penicillium malachiteum TaxID=1324776 RepID=UPI0025482E21|nr:uncharacterized protein N7483_011404 [Penicillium malachiteum]KAJ5714223.1 hypothetical protein N7483_011404 [Penicillium malachiteum]